MEPSGLCRETKMQGLFPTKGDFRIVRLASRDARGLSDHLRHFRNLVLQNEEMYPGIEKWLDDKVIPGLRDSCRVAYVGYLDEIPVVSAVVKRGDSSKFCHLKIREDLQDQHLGEAFFALMGLEVKSVAKEIHFTLPQGLWDREKKFFSSFGFSRAVTAGHQYRLFEDELRCSARFEVVWNAITKKMSKITRAFNINGQSCETKVLMSIKPENADKILTGKKKVEIRRRFSKKWTGCRISLYASTPKCSVVGDAFVREVVQDDPDLIWQIFGEQIGCTRGQFERYAHAADKLYAIILEDVVPYDQTISLHDISQALGTRIHPPQNYSILNATKEWAEAVSIGVVLQRSFGGNQASFI